MTSDASEPTLDQRPLWQPYPRLRHTLTAITECLVNGTDAHPPITAYRTAEARWWTQERPPLGDPCHAQNLAVAHTAIAAQNTHRKAA